MKTVKSPFFVYREFLSPLLCEEMVDKLECIQPDTDKDGHPIKLIKYNEHYETVVFEKFSTLIPYIEKHYEGYFHNGTEQMFFEWYPQETVSECVSENSNYINHKWARVRNRDLSCVVFLSDYQDKVPFDSFYEVYGGKLEFPQHHFGFNPERGTLIIYPSVPHFINAVSPIECGDLYLIKWHLAGKMPYLYNPLEFPGDYKTWFKGL